MSKRRFMKKLCILLITLGASISWGSGCDSRQVFEPIGSLQSIQIESDLGYQSQEAIGHLIEFFRKSYDNDIGSQVPVLPADSNFRTRTQWVTYKHLDTDCGWYLYQWTVIMKQLVIQISDDTTLLYPNLSHLRGEEIRGAPFLKILKDN
jgi:hypothetical protein